MRKFRKAYTAAAVAGATALGLSLRDGNLTSAEFLASLGVALLGGAAVYKVPNAD